MAYSPYKTLGLLPAGNPISSWVEPRRNALLGFGAGMLSNDWGDIGKSTMQGMALDRQYAMDAQEQAEQEQSRNATVEWLQSQGYDDLVQMAQATGDIGAAWSEGLKRSQPGTASADWSKLNDGTLYNQRTGEVMPVGTDGTGGTEYGLTPIWGQFADGTFGYGVQGKDGSFLRVDTGDLRPLDPRSLAGEKAYGTAVGGAQGEAVAAAPGDIANSQTALSILDQIENSPELPWATGTAAGMGANRIPGTGRYGFQNLVDQAKSGAFLSAIQEMRGLGALSNAEGQVATAAVTRMDTALSEADFRKALADYRAIIERGLARAQGRVGAQPNVNTPGAGGPAPSGRTLTYNPATGRLE